MSVCVCLIVEKVIHATNKLSIPVIQNTKLIHFKGGNHFIIQKILYSTENITLKVRWKSDLFIWFTVIFIFSESLLLMIFFFFTMVSSGIYLSKCNHTQYYLLSTKHAPPKKTEHKTLSCGGP